MSLNTLWLLLVTGPLAYATEDDWDVGEGAEAIASACVGICCPPSATEKVIIVMGTALFAGLCVVLLTRIMEKSYINQDRDPITGRHVGVSISLLLSVLALTGFIWGITGCIPGAMYLWYQPFQKYYWR